MILKMCRVKDPQAEWSTKNEHKPQNGNKQLVSTTHVGRDEQGIYICIEDADARRPKIRFYFGYTPFHTYVQGKEPGDRMIQSIIHAEAWVEAMKAIYPVSLAGECSGGLPAPVTPFNSGNGNNRGGGNNGGGNRSYNNGGNSGNYNNNNSGGRPSYDDDEDDLPM